MRRDAWSGATLFVALTGWGQQADKDLACDAGFRAHLTKPADPHELSGMLAQWAEYAQARAVA